MSHKTVFYSIQFSVFDTLAYFFWKALPFQPNSMNSTQPKFFETLEKHLCRYINFDCLEILFSLWKTFWIVFPKIHFQVPVWCFLLLTSIIKKAFEKHFAWKTSMSTLGTPYSYTRFITIKYLSFSIVEVTFLQINRFDSFHQHLNRRFPTCKTSFFCRNISVGMNCLRNLKHRICYKLQATNFFPESQTEISSKLPADFRQSTSHLTFENNHHLWNRNFLERYLKKFHFYSSKFQVSSL